MQRHKRLLSLIVWLRSNPTLVQRPMLHSRTYAEDSFESRPQRKEGTNNAKLQLRLYDTVRLAGGPSCTRTEPGSAVALREPFPFKINTTSQVGRCHKPHAKSMLMPEVPSNMESDNPGAQKGREQRSRHPLHKHTTWNTNFSLNFDWAQAPYRARVSVGSKCGAARGIYSYDGHHCHWPPVRLALALVWRPLQPNMAPCMHASGQAEQGVDVRHALRSPPPREHPAATRTGRCRLASAAAQGDLHQGRHGGGGDSGTTNNQQDLLVLHHAQGPPRVFQMLITHSNRSPVHALPVALGHACERRDLDSDADADKEGVRTHARMLLVPSVVGIVAVARHKGSLLIGTVRSVRPANANASASVAGAYRRKARATSIRSDWPFAAARRNLHRAGAPAARSTTRRRWLVCREWQDSDASGARSCVDPGAIAPRARAWTAATAAHDGLICFAPMAWAGVASARDHYTSQARDVGDRTRLYLRAAPAVAPPVCALSVVTLRAGRKRTGCPVCPGTQADQWVPPGETCQAGSSPGGQDAGAGQERSLFQLECARSLALALGAGWVTARGSDEREDMDILCGREGARTHRGRWLSAGAIWCGGTAENGKGERETGAWACAWAGSCEARAGDWGCPGDGTASVGWKAHNRCAAKIALPAPVPVQTPHYPRLVPGDALAPAPHCPPTLDALQFRRASFPQLPFQADAFRGPSSSSSHIYPDSRSHLHHTPSLSAPAFSSPAHPHPHPARTHPQHLHSHPHPHSSPASASASSAPVGQTTTCIPSLIPPGMDPAQVDMRNFYPYQPNEVKHRKRTTRSQLKVLEDVYKSDTKPNAALRKKLATELQMKPRGVQVWFQNRRAKSKMLAKKAAAARPASSSASTVRENSASPSPPPSPALQALDLTERMQESFDPDALSPQGEAHAHGREGSGTSSSSSSGDTVTYACTSPTPRNGMAEHRHQHPGTASPTMLSHPPNAHPLPPRSDSLPDIAMHFDVPFASPSPAESSAHQHQHQHQHDNDSAFGAYTLSALPLRPGRHHEHEHAHGPYSSSALAPPAHDLLAHRRPSLPILPMAQYHARAYGQGSPYVSASAAPAYDPALRRASIAVPADGHAMRLCMHPYAYVAAAANHQGPSASRNLSPDADMRLSPNMDRNLSPNMDRNLSLNARLRVSMNDQEPVFPRARYAMALEPVSPHTQAPPPNISARYGLLAHGAGGHGHGAYVMSTREMGPPIPGPLPAPGFSFGAPAGGFEGYDAGASEGEGAYSTDKGAYSTGDGAYSTVHRGSLSSEADTEGSEYDAVSRFGSVASVAGSETSWTSYYESDDGGMKEGAAMCEERRGSCGTSMQILEMFSSMGVSSASHPYPHPHSQSSPSLLAHCSDDPQSSPTQDASMMYAPVAGRSSLSPPTVQRSTSSELAYALSHDRCGGSENAERSAPALPSGFEYADPPPGPGDGGSASSSPQGQYGYPQARDGYAQAQDGYAQAQDGYAQAQDGTPKRGYPGTAYDVPTYAEAYGLDAGTYAYTSPGGGQEPDTVYTGGVEISERNMCIPASAGLQYVGFGAYGAAGYS
ncbi:hypothetical protein POSPLADRAFT_1043912 [Postia placenta MAD-698-R-SB12]|uniref:Homeobox domain-containing protein n=1 Tax=Postia placenta MAD-698-R-SB12 TaxID=670580 RepID=A0A1X6NCW6_9APHY|nr:hypothetical protein POSPLADRAFT_1043912 [Postia placenta MAD-698-R-SB12]OSX66485.1 hypothetical protein POSPLADRAFT_1043912 [Postia placenta MAD-698-R-SB12]